MPKDNKNLIVALDVGTSKVACLVAELRPDASLEILGMGGHESKGLKKGVVVNIEATVGAIQRALEEAELMADCKISSARSEEHTSELQSHHDLVCRLLLEKKKN